jgi:hypothetical protein
MDLRAEACVGSFAMNRFRFVGIAVLLCGCLAGCGTESREGLVNDTINRLQLAGSQVGQLTGKIKEATDDAKKSGKNKIDITEATKAADTLKETGIKIVEIKQRIDALKEKITDDEKKEYAKNQRDNLNKAFTALLEQQRELEKALADADVVDPGKTDILRKKVVEAMSPFEAQAKGAVRN